MPNNADDSVAEEPAIDLDLNLTEELDAADDSATEEPAIGGFTPA